MHWADMAPHQLVFKNKRMYKWENSPGLDHHCGVCATPLHNARARTSCIGKHVEPCYRFHQQLHYVGKSHECNGCTHAHEMHHLRHKNILKTVRKLAEIDEDVANHLIGKIVLHAPNSEDSPVALATAREDKAKSNDTSPMLKQAEWKKERKAGPPDTPSKRQDVEAFSKQDTDFISNAIHLEIHEGKGAWNGQNAVGAYSGKDELKEMEADSEAEVEARAKDVAKPTNAKRLRRVKKIAAVIKARHIYGSSKMESLRKAALNDPYDGLDPEILERLGIKVVSPHKNSPIRKELVRKLLAQVKEDVGIQAQERAEAQIRADGFWNWAGKSAYHIIMNNRENIDWATGVRRSAPNEKSSNQGQFLQLPEEGFKRAMVQANGQTHLDKALTHTSA